MSIPEKSAILFENNDQTIFIIDTPLSIAEAQSLSLHQQQSQSHPPPIEETETPARKDSKFAGNRHLLSTPPLAAPYPSTTEPKSESARAKVLARIPETERLFHAAILPLVEGALREIRGGYGFVSDAAPFEWCLPRCVSVDEENSDISGMGSGNHQPASISGSGSVSRKRSRNSMAFDKSSRLDQTYENPPRGSERHNENESDTPPVILSSSSTTAFESISDLDTVVKNPSSNYAILSISTGEASPVTTKYIIPPISAFVLCNIPLSIPSKNKNNQPIPNIPVTQKFNLLLFDPPWPNKSVRRSGHYQIHPYAEMDGLTKRLAEILRVHTYSSPALDLSMKQTTKNPAKNPAKQFEGSIAAIWITNSEKSRRAAYNLLSTSGFRICEEWIWVKVAKDGRPICPLDGLWRKPYEILVIGRRDLGVDDADAVPCSCPSTSMNISMDMDMGMHEHGSIGSKSESDFHGIHPPSHITRRVIAAVPDIHSRKPNLRVLFERIFFEGSPSVRDSVCRYDALEVFARNLTAGWWACGNEVLKFNDEECWVDDVGWIGATMQAAISDKRFH